MPLNNLYDWNEGIQKKVFLKKTSGCSGCGSCNVSIRKTSGCGMEMKSSGCGMFTRTSGCGSCNAVKRTTGCGCSSCMPAQKRKKTGCSPCK